MFDKKYIEEEVFDKNGDINKNFTRAKQFQPFINFLQSKEGQTIQEKLCLFYYNIEKPKCECGNYTTFLGFSKGYRQYCSAKCRANSEKFKEQVKESNLEKYGVENTSQTEKVKEKIRQTNLKRYGVDHNFKRKEIQDKKKKTYFKKYGVENPVQSHKIKEKIKQTNSRKYGVKYSVLIPKVRKQIKSKNKTNFVKFLQESDRLKNMVEPCFNLDKDYTTVGEKYLWKCKKCENVFLSSIDDGKIPRCFNCFPKENKFSKQEKEICNWLLERGFSIKENVPHLIPPYEIDIYLPEHNLGIEFNGLYWHSEDKKDKNYHQNKVKLCYNQGIRLLHVWEDDWINNPEEVKEKILYYINNLNEEIKPREPILEERMGFKIWT